MANNTCTVPDCGRPTAARQMCTLHYQRMRTHGTTAEPASPPSLCIVEDCTGQPHGHGYCVKHYKRWKKDGDPTYVAVADCVTCGEMFTLGARGTPSTDCSSCREGERRTKLYAKWAAKRALQYETRKYAKCQDCEGSYQRDIRDTKSIRCAPCQTIARRVKARAWEALHPKPLTDRRRLQLKAAKHRRRVLQRSAPSDKFTSPEIYERDGWICQLCGLDIDPNEVFPSRNSASLDHIVPLALGGTHTLDNVQLACMGCNWDKGVRLTV